MCPPDRPSTNANLVLVVNAGSATIKLALVDEEGRSEPVDALEDIDPARVVAVGHRIVHGGARFRASAVINRDVEAAIRELAAISPLHSGRAFAGIVQARAALPAISHVAVFDTAFHATIPDEAAVYPLPRQWREDWGIRRYGFHGISVAWSASRAPTLLGRDPEGLRLVVCHLGGGCSVTAVLSGRSVETTMGFTPLEGVAMETRSGSIDPGALIHVLREHGVTVDELDRTLNFESGLKGLSGTSGDLREVLALAPSNSEARLALDVYVHRIAASVAAVTTALGGLDAIAFTAGVGERSAPVRAAVCERLGFLGVRLDPALNADPVPDAVISAPGSAVGVLVIAAREDVVIAAEARRALGLA